MDAPADSSAQTSAAIAAIRAGKTAILPTDTVYGLVCDGYTGATRQAPVRAQEAP